MADDVVREGEDDANYGGGRSGRKFHSVLAHFTRKKGDFASGGANEDEALKAPGDGGDGFCRGQSRSGEVGLILAEDLLCWGWWGLVVRLYIYIYMGVNVKM